MRRGVMDVLDFQISLADVMKEYCSHRLDVLLDIFIPSHAKPCSLMGLLMKLFWEPVSQTYSIIVGGQDEFLQR